MTPSSRWPLEEPIFWFIVCTNKKKNIGFSLFFNILEFRIFSFRFIWGWKFLQCDGPQLMQTITNSFKVESNSICNRDFEPWVKQPSWPLPKSKVKQKLFLLFLYLVNKTSRIRNVWKTDSSVPRRATQVAYCRQIPLLDPPICIHFFYLVICSSSYLSSCHFTPPIFRFETIASFSILLVLVFSTTQNLIMPLMWIRKIFVVSWAVFLPNHVISNSTSVDDGS